MRVWLIDLDNTLHDARRAIFPRINHAMTAFVADRLGLDEASASELREHYWARYGATLLGLVRHHGVDAHEFLRETHPFPDIGSLVTRDHRLAHALRRLHGRRIVLTNAPGDYGCAVLRALGVASLIERVVSIEAMRFAGRFEPKPSQPMMRRVVASLRARAVNCVLVEDSVENLHGARAVGLRTVLVTGISERGRHPARRTHAGSGRRVGLKIHSFAQLPRSRLRHA